MRHHLHFNSGPESVRCRASRLRYGWAAAAALLLLSACGGSGSGGQAATSAEGLVMPTVGLVSGGESLPAVDAVLGTATAASTVASAEGLPSPDPGLLLLLLPDGQAVDDARVRAWVDAALEVGVRIAPVSDSQFLALGEGALAYAGLVLPDSLHVLASDEIVAAVQRYTEAGGQTLLVFDFGALTLAGDVPVYPVPRSRLSPMAGVDYVLYDQLRDRTTGLGPVLAQRSTLRSLLVPPGKSMPFNGLGSAPATAAANPANAVDVTADSLLGAAGISNASARYLPVSIEDPGGVRGFDVQQYSQMRYLSNVSSLPRPLSPRRVEVDLGRAQPGKPLPEVTRARLQPEPGVASALAQGGSDPLEAWSGYLLGPLIYPTYVTQGDFGQLPGQRVLATSPQFGLVAGINPVGAGRVLFVNLPLTYLKGRTDALMMHGFLHLFVRDMLQLPHLSPMPNAVAGLTLDWHVDAAAALTPLQKLINLNVFNDPKALFSVEATAGPDTIVPGDGLGMNLPVNRRAQTLLQTLGRYGHAVGSHGGWIHDYYGSQVSETNQFSSSGGGCVNKVLRIDNFEQCLVLNRQTVDGVMGAAATSYSAPEGNNPLWAMDWLEQRGVVAAYFGGHTGLGATRQYREGQLLNPNLWVFPVTPFGLYATFEEFQDYRVPQAEVIGWYRALADFSVAQNTSRMVYAHPPGALQWNKVLLDLLAYVRSQSPRLTWYTTPRLARFMTRRLDVQWRQAVDAGSGQSVFTVSHPSGLQEMTWRLPRSRFPNAPRVISGAAVVDGSDAQYWLVRATSGTQLVFAA